MLGLDTKEHRRKLHSLDNATLPVLHLAVLYGLEACDEIDKLREQARTTYTEGAALCTAMAVANATKPLREEIARLSAALAGAPQSASRDRPLGR